MDPKKAKLEELKIVEDIKLNCDLYKLEDLFSEEEISEAIDIISNLFTSYRHFHVELKQLLGDDYEVKYPTYWKNVEA